MARLASRSRLTVFAMALVIAYVSGLAAYLLDFLGPVHNSELGTLDWRFLFRGPVGEKPQEIALVIVGEAAELPYWAPVPREHLARVIRSVHQGGAKLIGVDFYLGARSFDAVGDSLLKEAIRTAGNVVLVSYLERDSESELHEYLPTPYFLDEALDYGYATFFTGTDVEAVREGAVAVEIEGVHALSLAGCLYSYAQKLSTEEIRKLDWRKPHDGLPGSRNDYKRIIDYNGPPFQYYLDLDREIPGGIAAFQSHQVAALPPVLAERFFKDKIVLLGSGLSDAPDLYRTSFFSKRYNFEKTFGVEIHAQLLRTLLSGQPLVKSGFFLSWFLILLPAFLSALVAVRLRPYWALPLTLVDIVLFWWLGFYLFSAHRLIVPLLMPTLSCGFACLFGLIYVGSTDGRRKNEVRDRFGPMMSSAKLREILEQPEAWSTEGEERIVSVLWVRLLIPQEDRSHRSARDAVVFFQDYWSQTSEIIFKHGGTIFRYEEEAIAAVFGAPLSQKEHTYQAAMAAIDIMENWLAFRKIKGYDAWELSLGADMGRAFVGELGGDEHYAYRVLGRTVDSAKALAEDAEDQGEKGEIRTSQEFLDQVGNQVESSLVGKIQGQSIYQIRGRASAPPIGAADRPANLFWKYLGLDRFQKDPVSEDLLSGLTLFSDFNRRNLRRIRPILYHRTYKAGERIFTQGEVGSGMYIIQTGTVDILQETDDGRSSQLLQRLSVGDFFGELALLSDLRRPASAVAYEPCELLVLFQADLYDLIEREPELGVRLIRSLSRITGERLIQINEELIKKVDSSR